MLRLPTRLTVLLVTAGGLSAQTPPPAEAAAPNVPALVAEAEKMLAANNPEDAARLLRAALANLPSVPSDAARSTFRSTIGDLLKRADPQVDARRKGEVEAAKGLLAAAEAYRKQGWPRTALELLRLAEELDPDGARKPLEDLRKSTPGADKLDDARSRPAAAHVPAAPAPGRREEFGDWFKTWTDVWSHGWKVRADGVESPRITDETSMLIGSKELPADYRLLVDVQHGDRESNLSIAFAVKSTEDYYLLTYDQYPTGKDSYIHVYRYDGKEMKELVLQGFRPTPAERSGWVTLELVVKGKEIAGGVLGRTIAKVTATTDLVGKAGLFISGNTRNKEPVRFRLLQVDKP